MKRKGISWAIVMIVAVLCFFGSPAFAQISVMRNYFPAPLEDSSYQRGFFEKLAFSAEGSRGFGSALGEQAWNIKYVGFVELYRFSQRSAIAGSLAHEFTANPHNEISFHIRGVIWNETVAYFHRLRSLTLEAGVTHHCRHEVDNTVNVDELAHDPDYVPTRRLIVLTGPYFSLQSNWLSHKKITARFYGRANLYTYYVDGRRTYYRDGRHFEENADQSLDYVRASALLGMRVNYALSSKVFLFNRSWYNPVYFIKDDPWKRNFRLEAGAGVKGGKGNFELFAGYESFFDDMSRPYPVPSNVFSVGIRGRSKDLF